MQFPSSQPTKPGQGQVDGAEDAEDAEDEEPTLEPFTFGSQTTSFPSKKAAKVHASAAAIAHLRRVGQLDAPGSSPPRKRQRQAPSDADAGMTVTQYPVDGLASPVLGAEEDAMGDMSDARLANQVHRLRLQLGLNNIEYRLKRTDGTAYYTGHAVFPMEGQHGFGAQLQGKVGELREEVFGKKQAKEAVAREVVAMLQTEVDRRAEAAGKGASGQMREEFKIPGLGNLVNVK